MTRSPTAAVDLHWIPLGAGGHSVRFNGLVFEAIAARLQRRRRCELFHAALVVRCDGERYTVELAPSPDADEAARGVVGTGAVGSRHLGWLRLFRYEVRCWRGGCIPDLGATVGGPHRLAGDPRIARRLLDLTATVPRPVWGRDELRAGETWNSNSMIAWLIAAAGLPTDDLRPPQGGRVPGWQAGLDVARRGAAHGPQPRETRSRSAATRRWRPYHATEDSAMSSPMPFKERHMSSSLRFAGIAAGLVLFAFGVGAMVIGFAGRDEVGANIKAEHIVGSDDMSPALIAPAVKQAGLTVDLPTCDVAGKAITNGDDAKCFAAYMRIHALEATGGKTYAQMPQYATADGKGTSDKAAALTDPKTGGPQSNPARQIWISETALGTALKTSYFAASVGTFAIVMGAALLLTGIGFIVLASGLMGPAVTRRPRASGAKRKPITAAPVH
jgi:hypothetical protein